MNMTRAFWSFFAVLVLSGAVITFAGHAGEAAEAFCRYKLRHLREAHERASGTKMEPPGWLADG